MIIVNPYVPQTQPPVVAYFGQGPDLSGRPCPLPPNNNQAGPEGSA